MTTVPVFAPNGDLGDIPAEKLRDAVKAGFQPGVNVQSADGQPGVIPAYRTAEAVKAGMKVVPIAEQPIQHQGFWSSLGGDLLQMMTTAAPPTTKEGLLQKAKMLKEVITGPDPRDYLQSAVDRMNAGRNPAYASVAGAGEQLGVNVKGMEQSAQQGDVGGVAGHAAAVPSVMAAGTVLGELPLGRMTKATGGAIRGGAERIPIVGPIAKGAIRGAVKSWRESAPVEISPSKVSTTAPEASPAVSLNRLTSDIQSLGYSKADALARAKAGIAKYPNDLNAATTEAMRPSRAQAQSAPTTPPPSKSAQIAQARVAQTAPAVSAAESVQPSQIPKPAAQSKPATQYEVAPPSKPLYSEGKPVPADTDLTPAIQKSIPQARTQGKIMQVVRREGTLGMDRLMKAPELQGLSREEVEAAAIGLGNSKKLWVPTKEADAHGPAGIISLAIRKP